MQKLLLLSTISLTAMMLIGCGEGNSSNNDITSTNTGYFIDSGVEGATYIGDKGTTGITGVGGSYKYLTNENITFSIGAVTLGKTIGSPVVSPIDFGTYSTNVTRLLMALDDDGNASNGISISTATKTNAKNWTTLEVNSTMFNTNSSVIENIIGKTLPSEASATSHLNSSLLCAYSGAFIGSWSGMYDGTDNVNGNLGIMVMSDGNVIAGGEQSDHSSYLDLSTGNIDAATKSLTINGNVHDNIGVDGHFTGTATFSNANSISGSFTSTGIGDTKDTIGTFNAIRIGGSRTATYRFTGFYRTSTGEPMGVYSLDIDINGQATGISHDFLSGDEATITGTATNGSLNLTVDGTTIVSGSINLSNGTITGVTWTDKNGYGTVTGAGCAIN